MKANWLIVFAAGVVGAALGSMYGTEAPLRRLPQEPGSRIERNETAAANCRAKEQAARWKMDSEHRYYVDGCVDFAEAEVISPGPYAISKENKCIYDVMSYEVYCDEPEQLRPAFCEKAGNAFGWCVPRYYAGSLE